MALCSQTRLIGQRRVVELSFGSPPPEMAVDSIAILEYVLEYSYSEDTYY
jgi:hypothetical protein